MSDRGGSRLDHVQGLRGIAMLVIVVYHCGLPPTGGFIALDTFFVISGYVIAGMLLREKARTDRISLVDFYHRRVRRLLPLLAATIVVTVLISALLESPLAGQRTTGRIGAFASVSLANVALYQTGTGYFDRDAESIPFRHMWSLSVEEQFYLGFPLFVALLLWGNRRRLWAVGVGMGTVGVLSYAALAASAASSSLLLIHDTQSFAYYSPVTRLWEMAFGVGIALWHQTRPPLGAPTARVVGLLGTLLLVVPVMVFTSELDSSNPVLAVPVLGSTMIMVACRTPGLLSAALSWGPICWIGDRSYGWYLWHWPFIVFADDLWPGSTLAVVLASLLGLAVSALTYPLIEQRFRYPPQDRPRRQQLRGGLRLAVVCVVLGVGASVALNRAAVHSWGDPDIRATAAQVLPRPLGFGQRGCPVDRLITAGSGTRCTVGEGAGAPIYLVGDSNAGQYGAGLLEAGDELDRPVVLLWKSGCAFNTTTVLRPSYEVAACDRHNREVVEWLGQAEPGTVVVSNGGEFVRASGVRLRASGAEAETTAAKQPLWEAGLTDALAALLDTDQQVVLMRMLPHPGGVNEFGQAAWSPTDCGLLRLELDRCAVSSTLAAEDRRQREELAVEDVAVRATGVDYVDLRGTICPDGQCETRADGDWVYRDSTHLTNRRSAELAPLFVDLLRSRAGRVS